MTQPTYQPPPRQPMQPQPFQPGPMQPQPRPTEPKRFGWLALILVTVPALLVGFALGSINDEGTGATAGPGATVIVTEGEPPEPTGPPPGEEPPADEPTEAPPAGYQPKKSDWQVKVKITDKQCYGSAGCNVEFKIHPQYIGSQTLPDSGAIEVTYEITGDEDPIIGTFTVTEGDQVEFDEEGSMSTPRSSTKVKATITDVSYDENG